MGMRLLSVQFCLQFVFMEGISLLLWVLIDGLSASLVSVEDFNQRKGLLNKWINETQTFVEYPFK